MSGRARLAVCAAVATLASACALLPLVTPAGWLLQAAWLIVIQSSVGALARRKPLAGYLTVAIQGLVSLVLLTVVFVPQEAVLGLLPGPAAFAEFGSLLQNGTTDVSEFAIPAPVTEGIRLLLVGGVVAIGLAVDALAVTYRSAAPAGLPLLALYSVAAGLAQGGARWLWFLCAACGYLVLLLAEGRERLFAWGQVFGSRQGDRTSVAPQSGGRTTAPVRAGQRIGAMALGIALVVPLLLPSLGSGLLDTTRTTGGAANGNGTVSAINPLVALQDSLNQPENRTALTYTTDAESTEGMYLRIVALDRFDGTSWRPSERRISEVPDPLPYPPGLAPGVRTTRVTSRITAADWYVQNWLPMPYPASRVEIDGRWRFEREGRTLVGDRGQSTSGARYTVESLAVQPTAEQLANAPDPPSRIREQYTEVPQSLPVLVRSTALQVTQGAANDYQRAIRLQDWFTGEGGFVYDTQVQAGSGSTAIVNFLENREGFCVHFSFTMAAMARTLGIPARVAVGFTPGTAQGNGRMAVGLQDAHAWPELYFEGVGWTRFEPTPSRGNTPSYTIRDTPQNVPGQQQQLPRPGTPGQPEAQPSLPEQCTAQLRQAGACGEQGLVPPGGGPTDRGSSWTGALWVSAAALALLAVSVLPLLWRVRIRSRRLGGAARRASHTERTLAAWRELIDSGWDFGLAPDASATPRNTVQRLSREGRLDPAAAEAARRIAHEVERVLYAPTPGPAPGLAADVHRVRAGLRDSAGRSQRLRALLLPRSAVQLLWALAERWSRLLARCSRTVHQATHRARAGLRPRRRA